jgi:hypothetical protein
LGFWVSRNGQGEKYSDLELCIKANQALGLDVMSAMAEDFSESDLPWKVDMVDWFSVSDAFKALRTQSLAMPGQKFLLIILCI